MLSMLKRPGDQMKRYISEANDTCEVKIFVLFILTTCSETLSVLFCVSTAPPLTFVTVVYLIHVPEISLFLGDVMTDKLSF